MPPGQAAVESPERFALPSDRMVCADGAAVLAQLQGSPLVDEGRVVMVGLDAVRDRFADRWVAKREQVWEHAERCFTRQFGLAAIVARVSETDFLIAQPISTRYAVQAACLSVLREVLTFFLGEARPADIRLREVTSLSDRGADCRPLEASQVMLAAASDPALTFKPGEVAPEDDASPDRWSPFATGDGRELKVSCAIDPVFEMQQVRLVGHRLEPRVTEVRTGLVLDGPAIRALSPGDRERVDLATIARGVNRLRATDRSARRPLLMLPAAFTTLGSTRGRTHLVHALREAKVDADTRIVCEIRELEGAPGGRLTEAVALVKPFCYAVVGRVADDRRALDAAVRCGFSGLSMEFNTREEAEQELLQRLQSFSSRTKAHLKVCMAFGLATPRQLALARLAGVTHGSTRQQTATAAPVTGLRN